MQRIDDRGCPRPEIPADQNEERRKAGNEGGMGNGEKGENCHSPPANKQTPYTDTCNKAVPGPGSAQTGQRFLSGAHTNSSKEAVRNQGSWPSVILQSQQGSGVKVRRSVYILIK